MIKNVAITIGALTCSASFVLAGCSDGTEPQKREDGVNMTNNGGAGMVVVNDGVQPPPAAGGTPQAAGGTPAVMDPVNPPPATGGMGMVMPPPASGAGTAIIPDPTGWVQADTNAVGIQGAWYSYNDCNDSPADCTLNHLPPEGPFDNIDGRMCTSGTTAIVAEEAEFSTKWGAGIALDLNGVGGGSTKMPYDAAANGVSGFGFTIEFNTPGAVRVNLPTPATEVASHFTEISAAGEHKIMWADVAQGSWIKPPDRVDLDPSSILSIQFQVPSKMGEAVSFDFCISNLTAL